MKDLLAQYGLKPRVPEAIDSSMLKDFADCPSMFYLRHILGLIRKAPDMTIQSRYDWGTCWHGVLENYYKADRDPVPALQWLEGNYPEHIIPTTDRFKRSKARMAQAFFSYIDKWREEDDLYEVLRHEQGFDLYNREIDFRWCGRIDSVRRLKKQNKIRVFDYKTSAAMGPLYFDQHELGFQFPGYVWATDQMSSEPVAEIRIDVFYMVSAKCEFFRRTFRYDSDRIREWVNNVKMWTDQIHYLIDNHLYEPEAWRKNWNQCTRYGKCTFLEVHKTKPISDGRLRELAFSYVEDRWDPLAERF